MSGVLLGVRAQCSLPSGTVPALLTVQHRGEQWELRNHMGMSNGHVMVGEGLWVDQMWSAQGSLPSVRKLKMEMLWLSGVGTASQQRAQPVQRPWGRGLMEGNERCWPEMGQRRGQDVCLREGYRAQAVTKSCGQGGDVDLHPKGLGKPLKGLREGTWDWIEGERAIAVTRAGCEGGDAGGGEEWAEMMKV